MMNSSSESMASSGDQDNNNNNNNNNNSNANNNNNSSSSGSNSSGNNNNSSCPKLVKLGNKARKQMIEYLSVGREPEGQSSSRSGSSSNSGNTSSNTSGGSCGTSDGQISYSSGNQSDMDTAVNMAGNNVPALLPPPPLPPPQQPLATNMSSATTANNEVLIVAHTLGRQSMLIKTSENATENSIAAAANARPKRMKTSMSNDDRSSCGPDNKSIGTSLDTRSRCRSCWNYIRPFDVTHVLDCGHLYHRHCLKAFIEVNIAHRQQINCCFCRQRVDKQLVENFIRHFDSMAVNSADDASAVTDTSVQFIPTLINTTSGTGIYG